MNHARIVVSLSSPSRAIYQFNLIDVDGPRRGQRLADFEVPADSSRVDFAPVPDPVHAARARYQLREYGKRNAYVVIDDAESVASE